MKLFFVLFLSSIPSAYSDNLYLSNITCDSSYPVTVYDASFRCFAEGCTLGSDASFTAKLSYGNLTSTDLYTTALVDFAAFSNYTAYSAQLTEAGFSQQLFFGNMVDICQNSSGSDNCPYADGNYESSFEYSIPSSGSFDSYFAGFIIEANVNVFDYYNNMDLVGECKVTLSTEYPEEEEYETAYGSSKTYFYLFSSAALIIVAVVALSGPKKGGDNDGKTDGLLGDSFDSDSELDVIERERSSFKVLNKKDRGLDYNIDFLASVKEESLSGSIENVITEEIPWPSNDEASMRSGEKEDKVKTTSSPLDEI